MGSTALRLVPVATVFQLLSAPPHFFRRIRSILDREFPDHWIGGKGREREREALILWPLCSPDLTPLIFSLKVSEDIVYYEKVQHMNELRDRIVKVAECVANEMFVTTRRQTE